MAARSSRTTPQELLAAADVDGALVGGASLKADDFLAIAERRGLTPIVPRDGGVSGRAGVKSRRAPSISRFPTFLFEAVVRSSMQTVLIVVHLMIVLALVVVVLLQKSEGGALGIGGGGGFMAGRSSSNPLSRLTAYLAAGFFATSMALTILAGYGGGSAFDRLQPNAAAPQQPAALRAARRPRSAPARAASCRACARQGGAQASRPSRRPKRSPRARAQPPTPKSDAAPTRPRSMRPRLAPPAAAPAAEGGAKQP